MAAASRTMNRVIIPSLILLLCAGCGREAAPPPPGAAAPTLSAANDPDQPAERRAEVFDAELARMADLPAAERMAELARSEDLFIGFLDDVLGTRLENKALYLLARWRFEQRRDQDTIAGLLDRLDRAAGPAYQVAGRGLRVRLHLRQGRLDAARDLAASVVEQVPEAAPLAALVTAFARVGTAPGRLSGTTLAGPADIHATAGWMLYVFVGGSDPESVALVRRHAQACRTVETALVVVTSDSAPLVGVPPLREAGSTAVVWASPADGGDLDAWVAAFSLPQLPWAVLVSPGPDRRILAVDPGPDELRAMLGR
jgi:hypothetical protein